MTLADLAELVTTRHCYLDALPTERKQSDSEVAAFLNAQFPAVDTVDLPYRTHCIRAGPA